MLTVGVVVLVTLTSRLNSRDISVLIAPLPTVSVFATALVELIAHVVELLLLLIKRHGLGAAAHPVVPESTSTIPTGGVSTN